MVVRKVSGDGLDAGLAGAKTLAVACGVMVVDGLPAGDQDWTAAVERLRTMPCIVAGHDGWASATDEQLSLVDLVVDDLAVDALAGTVDTAPHAARALAVHLRAMPASSIGAGLAAESALYSALQAGPEFQAWRAATPVRTRPEPDGPAVLVERRGDELRIQLARPKVRNALNHRMRDELLEALAVAEADPDLSVTITGQGPALCSGGDLDEFGTFPDPLTAHEIRLSRSIGAVLARIASRTTVHLHGACYGSGIELPAFAGRVTVAPDTTIALPEVGLGLIPGAGGTVSLPRRIGRHRTAWLALTRLPITAEIALDWGLADEWRHSA